jgi:hypothetical protein
MAGMIRTNVGEAPLKWTVRAIAREFGLAENTAAKRLSEAKILPAADGTYSTKEVVAGLFGDINSARLAELKERTTNWQLKNGALGGQLLDRAEIARGFERLMVAFRSALEATSMSRAEKTATLSTLSSWPIVVKEVAERQSKQFSLRPEKDTANGDGEEVAAERDSHFEPRHSGRRVKVRPRAS